jgi:hypothetical protein
MAEDEGRRLLAQSCHAFQVITRKEEARQPLPIEKKVTIPMTLPNLQCLTHAELLLKIGTRIASQTSASLTEPFLTAEDLAAALTTGYFAKEGTFEVSAHHRQSIRHRVREKLGAHGDPTLGRFGPKPGQGRLARSVLGRGFDE